MSLSFIRNPPGSSVSVADADALCAFTCSAWATKIAVVAILIAIAATMACKRRPEKPAGDELWFGGDISLGDGGNGQLRDISGMGQGAVGVGNLEGPVTQGNSTGKFR